MEGEDLSTPAKGRGGLFATQECWRLYRQDSSFMTRYFMSLTFDPPLQETLSNAGNPMPGIPAGVLVNSTVYALGLQILLKGAACRCYVPPASPAAPTACAGSTHFDMQLRPRLSTGLTPAGVAHSWVLGCTIYSAFGPGGYLLVCLYFILGSAVRAYMTIVGSAMCCL